MGRKYKRVRSVFWFWMRRTYGYVQPTALRARENMGVIRITFELCIHFVNVNVIPSGDVLGYVYVYLCSVLPFFCMFSEGYRLCRCSFGSPSMDDGKG